MCLELTQGWVTLPGMPQNSLSKRKRLGLWPSQPIRPKPEGNSLKRDLFISVQTGLLCQSPGRVKGGPGWPSSSCSQLLSSRLLFRSAWHWVWVSPRRAKPGAQLTQTRVLTLPVLCSTTIYTGMVALNGHWWLSASCLKDTTSPTHFFSTIWWHM
jgi:hypothetical protein